jgi:Family of unknown function (DUF5683)
MIRNLILTSTLVAISCYALMAQTSADTLKNIPRGLFKGNGEKVYHPDTNHSPQTAALRSALIPGWGQVYNHSYWKAPIIYAGLGLFGSSIINNQRVYSRFVALARIARTGTIPVNPSDPNYKAYQKYKADYQLYVVQNNYSPETLADIAGNYQRNTQLSILGVAGLWTLNIIEAYIEAKFIHSYSIDNNLSMKIAPGFTEPAYYASNSMPANQPALKIIFSYK